MLKIDQYNPVQALKKSGAQAESQVVKTEPQAQGSAPDNNSIGAATRQLQQAFAELDQQPDVDLDKVTAIKQALASGQFKLNDAQTAQDLLEFHKK
ncbi:flagellar biosynthesis anti-sigma factor FlgM [Rheinheimera marina]|uniref:Negative regulator of flagellin synthesis n=1 Tax=Rheinheimera marina TaxID=1774958 RepID=A0ABV9JJI8_9GAMM